MRPGALLVLIATLATLPAACGNERVPVPDLERPARPIAYETYTSPAGEVSFDVPRNWTVRNGALPAVVRISSGSAIATVYAYPRDDLATGGAAVDRARGRLLTSLAERAPAFRVTDSEVTERSAAPAVEIRGIGRVGARRVKTRSAHVYADGVEYVVDAYASPSVFGLANRFAFAPMLDSLELAGTPEAP